MRAAVITEIMSPYRTPVFNRLAEGLEGFLCLYLRETASNRDWEVCRDGIGYPYRVLPGLQLSTGASRNAYLNLGLARALRAFGPQAVICGGYNHTAALSALGYARRRGIPFILWSESTVRDERPGRRVYEAYKRWLVARCDGFVASGSAAVAYLVHLGAEASNIWVAPDAVDNACFEAPAGCEARGGDPRLLFVGRLVRVKGVETLLEALAALRERCRLGLTVVGEGPERARLEARTRALGLEEVEFTGFVQPVDMPAVYRRADLFVFPSLSDPWGLVLNEAMASGLPVVTSTAPGAVDDLLVEGHNGFSFAPGDAPGLAAALERFVAMPSEARRAMGENARKTVRFFSPARCARGFLEALGGERNRVWEEFLEYRRGIGGNR